jgi:hypothetical protein
MSQHFFYQCGERSRHNIFFFSALVQPAGKYNTINLYNLNQELLEKGEDNDTEKGKGSGQIL